jgi:hypothetical protein
MLRKLCAAFMLALAVSPFTAPFQTWVAGGVPNPATGTPVVALTHQAASDTHDAGSLMGPVERRSSRWLFVPARSSAFAIHAIAAHALVSPVSGVVDSGSLLLLGALSVIVLRV